MASLFKRLLMKYLVWSGRPRRIHFGPLRGIRFSPSPVTGLAPFYSSSERYVQQAITHHLQPGMVGIDVGANWGIHTLLMARRVGAGGHVWAFEPFPPVFRELQAAVELNRFNQVRCWQVALGNENGTLRFHVGENSCIGHLVTAAPQENELAHAGNGQDLAVQACRLDDFPELSHLHRLDLIKLDVEGAESLVLEGARQTICRFRPVMVIELHNPQQDVAVAKFCQECEYEIKRLSAGPPIECFDQGWPAPNGVWGTILAMPIPPRRNKP